MQCSLSVESVTPLAQYLAILHEFSSQSNESGPVPVPLLKKAILE